MLRHLDMHITNECNMRCNHCLFSSGEKEMEEISTDEIKKLILQFSELGKYKKSIGFFGGEPTLRKDIFSLIDYTLDKDIEVGIITNGIFNSDFRKQILKYKNILIKMDLDGGTNQTHDSLRNKKGHFDHTLDLIKEYVKNEIKVNITTVLSKQNIHELITVLELCKILKINSIMFFYFSPIGRGRELENISLSGKEWITAKDDVRKWIEKNDPQFNIIWENAFELVDNLDQRVGKVCDKLYDSLNVMSDGNVFYCGLLGSSSKSKIIGNIKNDTLLDIIRRTEDINYNDQNYCPVLGNDTNINDEVSVSIGGRKYFIKKNCPYNCELMNNVNVKNKPVM